MQNRVSKPNAAKKRFGDRIVRSLWEKHHGDDAELFMDRLTAARKSSTYMYDEWVVLQERIATSGLTVDNFMEEL